MENVIGCKQGFSQTDDINIYSYLISISYMKHYYKSEVDDMAET